MQFEVIDQHRGDEEFAEQHRSGQGQLAAGDGMAAGGGLFGLFQLGEDAPAIVQIALAGLGDMQAARGPCQQQGADAFFQGGDGAGHAGRRHIQAARGGGETLLLGDGEKHLHFLESVHRTAPVHVPRVCAINSIFCNRALLEAAVLLWFVET